MSDVLVIAALIALALAAGGLFVSWQVVQRERRRSDARVAELAAEISRRVPAGVAASETPSVASPAADSAPPVPASAAVARRSDAPPTADEPEWVLGAGAETATSPVTLSTFGDEPLFAISQRDDARAGSRLVPALAVGALIVAGLGTMAYLIPRLMPSAGATAGAPTPVELVSLEHTVDESSLSISGLVRNPEEGGGLPQVTAVAFVFDAGGQFLASARAPLAFATLAPGDEAPFTIALPRVPRAARYRVSFRLDDNTPVPHVDRRPAPAATEDEAPRGGE